VEKDLIIGAASNYSWDQLKYWVNSIKKTSFSGDIAIVGTNMKKETIDRLTEKGVILSLYGKQNERGDIEAPQNGAPHVERFFYIWNFLETSPIDYNNVITTDTRDVIFQGNPSEWLDEYVHSSLIVASSEGMRYVNEPWGNKNLYEALGPFFHNKLKNNLIYNVGVLAGEAEYMKGLMLMLFQISINRPIPVVDQAMFNFLINTAPYKDDTLFTNNMDAWAIQLGTTLPAVQSGKGDLGMIFKQSPEKYLGIYEDNLPLIEDGVVTTIAHFPYCVVHQYDRVDGLKEKVEEIYGE
jgi:hypothetical protein